MSSKLVRKLLLVGLSIFLIYTGFSIVTSLSSVRIPTANHPTELYANQLRDDLRITIKKAINSAEKSVTLLIYSLSDQQIIHALNQKAEEGVEVKVVCDPNGSKSALYRLSNRVTIKKERPRGLMHQKILVIDGKNIWIGSANMTTESLRLHGNIVVGLYSPELATYIEEKAQDMQKKLDAKEVPIGNQMASFYFLPDEKQGIQKIIDMINTAQKTIKIAMFTWTHKEVAGAVIEAHKRGVNVGVVVDRYSGNGAGRAVVETLQKSGISISFSQGQSLLHYKMMIIDDEILVTGSANWTKAAFKNNNDCFLVLNQIDPQHKKFLNSLWGVIQNDSLPSDYFVNSK